MRNMNFLIRCKEPAMGWYGWYGTFYRAFNWLPPYLYIKLSVRWCVWKYGEGFSGRVLPKTLIWLAVYSSVTFHING